MSKSTARSFTGLLVLTLFVSALSAQTAKRKPGTYVKFDTSMGSLTVRLMPELAPKAVANFVGLAEGTIDTITGRPGKSRPYYDGITFHRVIPGFMIQGGDPTGTGTGGPGYTIPDEFSKTFKFNRAGILAMANKGIPNSSGGQFFITVAPYPSLNGKYTPFGEVVSGLDVVQKISTVKTTGKAGNPANKPLQPVVIKKVTIEQVK
jgi:peptidyl-prolyl cis-trans isomerase A (cyclophilin A)